MLLLLAVLATLALAWFRIGPVPEIVIHPSFSAIGPRTPVEVSLQEPRRGLSTVQVEVLQEGKSTVLLEEAFEPRSFWSFWGGRTAAKTFPLEVGRETVSNLQEGEATIRVTAGRAPTWLRSPKPVSKELTLPVRLRPPRLELTSGPNYATQGGSGVVTYQVGSSSARDGVQAGEWWFPGFPLPGGAPGDRFALFGAPYDLDDKDSIRLWVSDELGNIRETPFLDLYKLQPLRRDTIRLNTAFLERVVPLIQAESPEIQQTDDLLAGYLAINGDLRRANGKELNRLAGESRPEFLWQGPFRQLPGSQVMSSFADRRTYTFEGKEVDHQDHLGFDLASTRRAPVPASNGGDVVLAGYFGIYGSTVVLDHGYGLMTLYAHLSSISVEVGQSLSAGEIVGRTGQTGLAGGDHLHFTMLIQGLAVNPVEWWDRGWITNNVTSKLQPPG
ncbi:MAG: M23 family metallopeptidase [Deltaproteobacteria bacterium]|nr:M23 family metallopeptidase [Deltaproteobacteria bacterium]